MICKNCGFEFDQGELCPTCGAELVYDTEVTEPTALPEETQPEEEKIETSETTPQPEISKANPPLKRLLITLTAIICAVAILCTAAIGIFAKITYDNLGNRIDEAILKGYEIGTKKGWRYGWNNGWNDGYDQALGDESYYDDYDKYEDYDRYEKFFDNPESEFKFPDGHLKLKEYSTTKDTLSADKEVCEVSFKFEVFNDTDEVLTFGNIIPSVYSMDSMLSSLSYAYETYEVMSESYPANDYGELEISAKSSAIYEVTFVGSKSDSVNVGIEFYNYSSEYILSANYYIEFD